MSAYAHTARNYFYHLRFELYPVSFLGDRDTTSTQTLTPKASASQYINTAGSGWKTKDKGKEISGVQRPLYAPSPLQVPVRGTDIFGKFQTRQTERVKVNSARKERVKVQHAAHTKDPPVKENDFINSIASTDHITERESNSTRIDWRFGLVNIKSLDMDVSQTVSHSNQSGLTPEISRMDAHHSSSRSSLNLSPPSRGYGTQARFEPSGSSNTVDGFRSTDVGWGVVHLYRDGEESPALMSLPEVTTKKADAGLDVPQKASSVHPTDSLAEEDTTILCIPAVPSYMTPSDFLGWVGPKTREEVSHFRMVMTRKMNRYLVLMKFRDSQVARKWRQAWDGKVFSGMEVSILYHAAIDCVNFGSSPRPAMLCSSSLLCLTRLHPGMMIVPHHFRT